ncbi:hypothetical protein [Solicola sp. PLA-1-18]|uniref:hypothetical protein n=1 Tax=Solicola sp. PLA-1-18 TaxID=3380532 RepID=UPI003B808E8B
MSAEPICLAEAGVADAIVESVRSVPGVAGLHGGAFGEVATYLPGRRVTGVRLTPAGVEVHILVFSSSAVVPTAEAVRRTVRALVPGQVDVTVQDLVGL